MNASSPNETTESAVWSVPGRGARLIVDLDAIQGNVQAVAVNINPRTKIMVVVKAGGYGHGGPRVAEAALAGGAAWLGVATVSEGIELRNAGITAPILVLSPTMIGEAPLARDHLLDITVGSVDQTHELWRREWEQDRGEPLNVHLKVNTGMNRFGVNPGDAMSTARRLADSPGISLRGVYTHFASADAEDTRSVRRQAEVFEQCLQAVERESLLPSLVHASNSAALLRFREYDYGMVRAGICVYGVRPASRVSLFAGMRPAMRVEAIMQRVATIDDGDSVGYGGTFTAGERTQIGLISLGYADGYHRSFSNRSWVGLSGTPLPVAGLVAMDQTVVRFPAGCDARAGEVVTVVGDGSNGEPTLESLAAIAQSIPYEIMTAFGLRLPVFYVRGQSVVACDNESSGMQRIFVSTFRPRRMDHPPGCCASGTTCLRRF